MRLLRLVSDIEADIYCVDKETEILTRQGWRRYDTIQVTDNLDFQPGDRETEADTLLGISRFESEGEALQISANGMSQVLHPKHRVIYQYRQSQQVACQTSRRDAGVLWANMSTNGGTPFEGKPFFSDDKIRLAAWLISEGISASPR